MQFMAKTRKPGSSLPHHPRRERAGENLNVWVRSDLVEAVRVYAETSVPRITKTAIVEAALEMFLRHVGQMPKK